MTLLKMFKKQEESSEEAKDSKRFSKLKDRIALNNPISKKKNTEKDPSVAKEEHHDKRNKVVIDENYGSILTAKQKKELVKEARKRREASVQRTIPYTQIFRDGICRHGKSYYTKMMIFYDTNYELLSPADREMTFDGWCDFYNYFDPDIHLQVCGSVLKIDLNELEKHVLFADADDAFNGYRKEYSEILKKLVEQGRNEYARAKYVVFGVEIEQQNVSIARRKLEDTELKVSEVLDSIGVKSLSLNRFERLNILRNMLNPEDFSPFLFNDDLVNQTGLSTKDFIAPTSLRFDPRYFKISDSFVGQSCFLQILGETLDDSMLRKILQTDSNILFSIHAHSMSPEKALKELKRALSDVQKRKVDEQQKNSRKGVDWDILPVEILAQEENLKTTLDNVRSGDDRLFLTTIILTVMEKDKKKLDNSLSLIKAIAQQDGCMIRPLDYRQEQGYMSCLPLGVNMLDIERPFLTRSVAALVPFTTIELFMKTGEQVCVGLNQLSDTLILVDRKKLDNPNGLILGVPGAGKSFLTKKEFINVFFKTQDDIMIIDPESEYGALVTELGGEVVVLSPASSDHINPLDIVTDFVILPNNANHVDLSSVDMDLWQHSEDVIKEKVDFVVSLFEQMIGGVTGLAEAEKSVIDTSAVQMYEQFFENPSRENMPILSDLQKIIESKGTEAAFAVSEKMSRFTTGSSNLYNYRTNVDVSNRIVCFDIQNMGEQLKKMAMFSVQDYVWSRVRKNRAIGKFTRYYMDEFHLLLRDKQTAKYTVEMYKRFRKFGGVPTGITQNITDLLASPEIANIFGNCEYICMLKQKGNDVDVLMQYLDISNTAMKYVTNCNPGNGLLFCGGALVPFKDRFPTDTKIYKLINTRFADKAAELEQKDAVSVSEGVDADAGLASVAV